MVGLIHARQPNSADSVCEHRRPMVHGLGVTNTSLRPDVRPRATQERPTLEAFDLDWTLPAPSARPGEVFLSMVW